MPATALATAPRPEARPRTSLRDRVEELTAEHVELWRSTDDGPPAPGRRWGLWTQWRNARAARRLVDRLAADVAGYPDEGEGRRAWRASVEERLRRFGEERLGWPPAYRDLLFADAFFDATREFVAAARRFDPELAPTDLGQALRNVWIMNSLQMLLGRPVGVSPSIVAYSLLYPYTDNFLDDPAVPSERKRGFSERLRRRLRGEPVTVREPREGQVFRLVGRIESEYPRPLFPEVFDSLLAIHRAQTRSLEQQAAAGSRDQLLAISVEKGGTSVLADGFLVAGRLRAAEERFCFGYGVFLQLLDDLQDARADRRAGHATLFSVGGPRERLERTTARLLRLIGAVLDGSDRFAGPRHAAVRDLIRRNSTFLLMSAVARAPGLFRRRFRRRLEGGWPLRVAANRRLERRVGRRRNEVGERLRRERGVASPLDLLL